MGKKGTSGLGLVAAGVAALLGYNLLRQGQNTAATFTTARPANFRPLRLRGLYLDCEVQVLFTNTHPSRSTTLQSLGLTIASESGVIIGTISQPRPQQLLANTTTAVTLPVSIELAPLFLQVLDYTSMLALLRSFTSVGSVLGWVVQRAGLRNCVLDGQAQVDGLVLPVRKVVDLGVFAPTPPRPVAPAKPTARATGRALTKKVTA